MSEQGTSAPARPPGREGGWADWRWLVLLVVVAAGLRAWQLAHTEVASRDSIGYIRIAWRLEHGAWGEVMRTSPQHPGYPLTVLAVSLPVRRCWPADLALAMQLSAQLATALASVLLVVPAFYLGRELFDRRVGFWSALLVQCLPMPGRVFGDGLSEGLLLLLALSALVFTCRGLRTGSLASLLLAGLFGGLAYLTRPEGALVPLAAGAVVLGLQLSQAWRRPWPACLRGGAVLALGALVVALPYAVTIGGLTVKPTIHHMNPLEHVPPPPTAAGQGPIPLAFWRHAGLGPWGCSLWAVGALARALVKGSFYVLWAPALLGLWLFRDRFRRVPGTWVVAVMVVVLALVLHRVAQVMGYLGERHALLILVLGNYWAVAALLAVGAWLGQLLSGKLAGPWLGAALLGCLAVAPLGKTLAPLHGERAGFRQAGAWLAEHALPGDQVIDPFAWAGFYAGYLFHEGEAGLPAHHPPVCYVVLDEPCSRHPHLKFILDDIERLAHGGKEAVSFPREGGRHRSRVVVYEVGGGR
jgi:hypothetical protein